MQEADGVHASSAFSIRFRLNCLCEIEARQFCGYNGLSSQCHFQLNHKMAIQTIRIAGYTYNIGHAMQSIWCIILWGCIWGCIHLHLC